MPVPAQRTFDDLGAPLFEVPFCVLDIETTGGSPADCAITELGAVKYRGGDVEGTFHTLVDPGCAIPPFITVITGITHAMVVDAPPISEVLPAFLEFLGDAVIVGHNVRFDLSFLNAACDRLGYPRLPRRSVDTLALARRLVRGEVRRLDLASLAAHFRSPVKPTHRALDDARATAHVLWSLMERAGTIGVTHLDDLLTLPTARGAPSYRKLSLTDGLPRRPGVYLFGDRDGEVIYVGKAKDLRSRVRSYFYGDQRRSVATMLRELATIDHRVCETELEAEVTELRLIQAHRPRHNRRSRPGAAPHWVVLTDERFPRLSMVRRPRLESAATLGPFRGLRSARRIVEALWDALPIRRCAGPPGRRSAPCAFAQLGVALCPCDGTLDEVTYRETVARLVAGVEGDPGLLLGPLDRRIAELASRRRFEEAAWVRDRRGALAKALERRRAWIALRDAGLIRAEAPDGGGAVLERGRLVAAWADGSRPPLIAAPSESGGSWLPVPESLADAEEAHLVWRWLTSGEVRLLDASAPLVMPARPVPALERIAL
jgi:DNA polymerase-3 subunit epsilon